MKPFFSDGPRIREEAKRNALSGISNIKRWWTNRYQLPPTHALFINQSMSELLLEMYEDFEMQKRDVEYQLESGAVGGDSRKLLLEKLMSLNEVLQTEEAQDPLWDEWEADLEAGRVPDLDKV